MAKGKFLEKPPWSGNEVSVFSRAVAWALAVFILGAVVMGLTNFTLVGFGVEPFFWYDKELVMWNIIGHLAVTVPVNIYFMILLFYIGKNGKAPLRWVPWR